MRFFHRAGHAGEVLHRPQADVQIQLLAQSHVQGADTATYRGGQRAFDRDHVIADRVQGFFGQPNVRTIHMGRFLTRKNLHPGNLALAAVGLGNRRVNHLDHHRRDIQPRTVTLDVRNDGLIRHVQRHVRVDGDFLAVGWNFDVLVHGWLIFAMVVIIGGRYGEF